MMPKGVEHIGKSTGTNERLRVRIPMMPKGVEHKINIFLRFNSRTVIIPMMPKGVEHFGKDRIKAIYAK